MVMRVEDSIAKRMSWRGTIDMIMENERRDDHII